MKRVFTGNSVSIETKTLTFSGHDRLVVSVSTGIVEEVSADGVNRALTRLTELHSEIFEAINALVAARDTIDKEGKES